MESERGKALIIVLGIIVAVTLTAFSDSRVSSDVYNGSGAVVSEPNNSVLLLIAVSVFLILLILSISRRLPRPDRRDNDE